MQKPPSKSPAGSRLEKLLEQQRISDLFLQKLGQELGRRPPATVRSALKTLHAQGADLPAANRVFGRVASNVYARVKGEIGGVPQKQFQRAYAKNMLRQFIAFRAAQRTLVTHRRKE